MEMPAAPTKRSSVISLRTATAMWWCTYGDCRNNLGEWPTRRIRVAENKKGFAYYAAKDAAMAQDARCGIMLWDGKSKGTLNNIQNLVGAGKATLVYFAPDKTFSKLTSEDDLRQFLEGCDPNDVRAAQREIRTTLRNEEQLPLQVV